MKITKEDATNMDLVLTYLLKNDKARMKSKQIQDLLNIGLDEAHRIYETILEFHHKVEPTISILNADNIAFGPEITESFLKKGGFVAVYEQYTKKEIDKTLTSMTIAAESKWLVWQRKTYWFTFTIAILGFVIALISLFLNLKVF